MKCVICSNLLSGDRKVLCGKKKCKKAHDREMYRRKKINKLRRRPCPCCGKIIPNTYSDFCSDICMVENNGIHRTEEKFIRKNKYNIVVLANMARMLPESVERIREIQCRLERKYKEKYRYSLPAKTMLIEFGFIDDVDIMSTELHMEGMLTGTSYEEVAYDMSIYRKLFDYGCLLELIQ